MTDQPTAASNSPRTALLVWRVLALAWAVVIFKLSTQTFSSSFSDWLLAETLRWLHIAVSSHTFRVLHYLFRKSAHLTEYAIFAVLLYGAFRNRPGLEWRGRAALWAVVAAGGYSLTDEFHQLFEPGRTASLVDCGIDTAGAMLGIVLIYAIVRMRSLRRTAAAA